MAKLDEQIKTMAGYFAADCEADGRLSLVLEVEHFITCSDGRAANFAAVQAAMTAPTWGTAAWLRRSRWGLRASSA